MQFMKLGIPAALLVATNTAVAGPCGPDTMHVASTASEWEHTEMACEDGIWSTTQTFEDNGLLKFTVAADWSENYGDNEPRDGQIDSDGSNILVSDAGTYLIELNFEEGTYALSVATEEEVEEEVVEETPSEETPTEETPVDCGTDAMAIRGTFNEWEAEAMVCVEGEWTATIVAVGGDAFKFDVFSDWSENYGVRDGAVLENGENIYIESDGEYDITFDYAALTASVAAVEEQPAEETEETTETEEPQEQEETGEEETVEETPAGCGTETMQVRGSFNDWESQAMDCNGAVWETTVTAEAGTEFKFDVAGDWAESYGENDNDGVADANGSNIQIIDAGTYTVLFNFADLSYLLESSTEEETEEEETAESDCGSDSMNLRGSFNDWDNAPMTCVDGEWTLTITADANTTLKFDVAGDWSENYGDNGQDGTIDENGSNIQINDAGSYSVTVDYVEMHYIIAVAQSSEEETEEEATEEETTEEENTEESEEEVAELPCGTATMHLRGSFNAWDALAMSCLEGGVWAVSAEVEDGSLFKFDETGDWSIEYGDFEPRDGILDASGSNIYVETAGTYLFWLNPASGEYVLTAEEEEGTGEEEVEVAECGLDALYVRGSHNGWEAEAMNCADSVFTAAITAEDNTLFKLDVAGDWAENYGDNEPRDGLLDNGGSNIVINTAGDYLLTIDFNLGTYALTATASEEENTGEESSEEEETEEQPEEEEEQEEQEETAETSDCGADTLYLRGTHNSWDAAESMTCADGIFSEVIAVEANAELKFDVLGDWSSNFGDSDTDGTLDEDGSNIRIFDAGSYVVNVDYVNGTYVIAPQ